jgi:predicted unusual protein kinase regulating ubiquinone biosynthesis (AarF/ABC1/UbiB family)
MVKEDLATDSLRRAMRMGNLGFRIAGSYLGYQLQSLFLESEAQAKHRKTYHQKTARRFREELQTLRGPIMKLGQALSMQSQVIPDEAIQELTELQMHAPPMHPTLLRTQFKKSLGAYPEEIFRRFDVEPFAAASLGQVHYAVTPSKAEVAVKIQYPAIRQAIQNDFALLRSVTLPVRLSKYLNEELLREAEEGILLETDYQNEARNIEYFRENLKELDYVRVPKVFPEYTTEKVLTMSLMRGEFLDHWLHLGRSQHWRDQIGSRLFEMFTYQFTCLNAIHADPHPGNYLYDKSGSVSLIDFGCAKYFSDRMRDCSRLLTERGWQHDEEAYSELMTSIFGDRTDPTNEDHRRVMDSLIEFFELVCPRDGKIVDFGKKTFLDRLTGLWNHALKNQLSRGEMFFLCRAELGLYNVLYKLSARVKTTQISERVRDKTYR